MSRFATSSAWCRLRSGTITLLEDCLRFSATSYREARLARQPDIAGIQVFGANDFAARESDGIEKSPSARRTRTFSYRGEDVVMWQHLKIGVKDSVNRTLRVNFLWDPEAEKVVIGHCGRHLPVPGH